MLGVERNEQEAKRYHAAFSEEDGASLFFGIDLETGEGLYELSEFFEKETVIDDLAAYPTFPESTVVELHLLHRSLAKRYAKAARRLASRYTNGNGVRKDFLRSYAYLNLALEYATDLSEAKEYKDWLEQKEWELTMSQIIYAQQLSNEILSEIKRTDAQ